MHVGVVFISYSWKDRLAYRLTKDALRIAESDGTLQKHLTVFLGEMERRPPGPAP